MHRAAPKAPETHQENAVASVCDTPLGLTRTFYARPSNLELSKTTLGRVRRAPPSSLDAKPEQREEESG
jgi:hypothetical protein